MEFIEDGETWFGCSQFDTTPFPPDYYEPSLRGIAGLNHCSSNVRPGPYIDTVRSPNNWTFRYDGDSQVVARVRTNGERLEIVTYIISGDHIPKTFTNHTLYVGDTRIPLSSATLRHVTRQSGSLTFKFSILGWSKEDLGLSRSELLALFPKGTLTRDSNRVEINLVQPIWEGALTAKSIESGAALDCRNAETTNANKCSNTSTLDDDDFTFDDVAYSVTGVSLHTSGANAGKLVWEVSPSLSEDLKKYMLVVDGERLPISDANIASASNVDTLSWANHGLSFAAGEKANFALMPGTFPTGLTLATGDGKLTASWDAPYYDGGSPITRYDLEYKESAAPDQAATNGPATGWVDAGHTDTGLSRELTGLTNYVGYKARVRAVNADGSGDWSAEAKGRPLRPGQVEVWDAYLTVGNPTFGLGCGTPQTPTTTKQGCSGRLSDTDFSYRDETYNVDYVNLRDRSTGSNSFTDKPFRFALDRPFARGGGGFLTLIVNGRPFAWEEGDDHGCHHCDSPNGVDRTGDFFDFEAGVKTWYHTGLDWASGDTIDLALVYTPTVWFGNYEDSTVPYDEVWRETPYFPQLPGFPDSSIGGIWVRLSEPAPAGGLTLSVSVDPSGTATEGVDFELLTPTVTLAAGAVYGGSDAEDIRLRIIDDTHEDSGETIILNVSAGHDFITRDIRITILNHDAPLPEGAVEYIPPRGSNQQATGQPAPEPADVQVTPGDGALTVTWTVSPREGFEDAEIRHALRWSQQPGVWANPQDPKAHGKNDGVTVEGGVYSYTITGLENGVVTGVFVRSFIGDDHTEQAPLSSEWVEVKGESTTPRAMEPFNVRVTPGDGALTVAWTVSPRVGFEDTEIRHALRWSQVSGVWANPRDARAIGKNDGVTVDGGVSSYTITGLENGVATGVFVRSFTGDDYTEGADQSSEWVRVKGEETTPKAAEPPAPEQEQEQQAQVEPPGPVVNLQLLGEADSLTVTWEAPESGGAPDGYIVHLKPEDGGRGKTKRPMADKTTVTFRNLEAGATYKVWVRAQNEAGKGERVHAGVTLPEPEPVKKEQQQATPKTFSVSATASAAEGGNATLTVTLSEAAPADGVAFTVTVGYSGSSTATANDVGSITSPVTVTEGNNTLSISIPIADDAVDEDDETFTVTVAASASGWEKAGDGQDTATVTITDDDTAGVTVTPTTLSISEDGSGTYTVVLDSKPTADVTVTPTGSDDGAASFAPASYTFTPSDWSTARTFTVSGVADEDRDNESVTISHEVTGSDAKYDGIAADSVAVSVADTTPAPAQEPPPAQEPATAPCPEETAPPVPGQKEPYNVCVTPGDGTLTITWTVAPRAGFDDDSIKHALRWSQVAGVWANPPGPLGFKNDGIVIEGGVATYTITGLQNGVATGVFVRSFMGTGASERSPLSSKWVRIKGENTTPRARRVAPRIVRPVSCGRPASPDARICLRSI